MIPMALYMETMPYFNLVNTEVWLWSEYIAISLEK